MLDEETMAQATESGTVEILQTLLIAPVEVEGKEKLVVTEQTEVSDRVEDKKKAEQFRNEFPSNGIQLGEAETMAKYTNWDSYLNYFIGEFKQSKERFFPLMSCRTLTHWVKL